MEHLHIILLVHIQFEAEELLQPCEEVLLSEEEVPHMVAQFLLNLLLLVITISQRAPILLLVYLSLKSKLKLSKVEKKM